MKSFVISLLLVFSFFIAFTQTTKQKQTAANTTQSQQTLYFRGYGPCDLSKEITENEKKILLGCIGHDTSAVQIKHDLDHPGKELAPVVKKLSEESKACIVKTAKFSQGPKSCPKSQDFK